MLTEADLGIVKNLLRILCRFGWVDLDFEENTDRSLQRTTSKWKRPLLLARSIFSTFYLAFIITRIPETLNRFKETNRFDDCVIHGILVVIRAAVFVNHATSITSINVAAELLNNMISLNTRFGLLYFNKEYLDPNLREKILGALVIVLIAAGSFLGCIFLAVPDSPSYLFSVLTHESRNNYLIFFCFLVLEFWISADLVVLFTTFAVIEFVYIFSTNHWLKYLCSTRQRVPTERDHGDPEFECFGATSLNLYHQLYILNTLQGLAFGSLFLPAFKLINGVMSTVSLYTLIKLGDKVNLLVYFFAVNAATGSSVTLIPATYAMSEMYDLSSIYQSEQMRQYLNIAPTESMTKEDRKFFLRNNKSAAIIRCKVGSLYWMEKDAKATLIELLLSGLSNLLLTFK